MIEELFLKFGSSSHAPALQFKTTPITVFVGPNYSGKSKLIREIQYFTEHGTVGPDHVILDKISLRNFTTAEAQQALKDVTTTLNPGEVMPIDHVVIGRWGTRHFVPPSSFMHALSNLASANDHQRRQACQWYFSLKTRLLDGASRIGLTNDQAFGDLNQPATSSFQVLFRDDKLRKELRDIIFDAFGEYLVIDPTQAGQLRLRLSPTAPPSEEVEQGLTQKSAKFHGQATLVGQASDGAKAFIGILAELRAGRPDIMLIDEPEAFLHPSLAFKLGAQLAKEARKSNKKIFVATHSAQFLMGCVASGIPVNVVRLTYRNKVATARLLPSRDLANLMKNPLLRSAGVLSALFFENVVMTEGDTDRAFYQEINERLLSLDGEHGIPNCLFINANGKDAIPIIAEPLRKLGIPVAAVYDIDFVKDGGTPSTKRLNAAGIPNGMHQSLNTMRTTIKSTLEAKHPQYKRNGGIGLLKDGELATAEAYLGQLEDYGIFLVPRGEVECWLGLFGIKGHAAEWLIPMFERMGEDGSDPDYVTPGTDDVWAFLQSIRKWLLDPERRGMPN